MSKCYVLMVKICGLAASCALALGVAITPAACGFMFHQPKVPQGMSKFVKDSSSSENRKKA